MKTTSAMQTAHVPTVKSPILSYVVLLYSYNKESQDYSWKQVYGLPVFRDGCQTRTYIRRWPHIYSHSELQVIRIRNEWTVQCTTRVNPAESLFHLM